MPTPGYYGLVDANWAVVAPAVVAYAVVADAVPAHAGAAKAAARDGRASRRRGPVLPDDTALGTGRSRFPDGRPLPLDHHPGRRCPGLQAPT
ncbi:hypothetical protein ABT144_24185 [Streptomyces sp. NPDC002039]|uniref:hypothetical protein n=1 Tax=Streptomyces sp. NPDC002039 TaxID=3154660 RepID=UPI003332AA8B